MNKLVSECTPDELRALADKMEDESRPIKTGILKHDLYDFEDRWKGFNRQFSIETDDWYFSEEEKVKLLEQFQNSFKVIVPKGTEFTCYLIDGDETWFACQFESMDSAWAEKHLENIRLLRNFEKS